MCLSIIKKGGKQKIIFQNYLHVGKKLFHESNHKLIVKKKEIQ